MAERFRLERFARRNANYLEQMVDSHGLPYFNTFWTDPAECVHDWPDYGDVNSRQLEAAVMSRYMTGVPVRSEPTMRATARQYLKLGGDGLLWRPETPYTRLGADLGDNTMTLGAFTALTQDEPGSEWRGIGQALVDRLWELATKRDDYAFFSGNYWSPEGWTSHGDQPGGYWEFFFVQPLLNWAEATGSEVAIDLGRRLAIASLEHTTSFSPEGRFVGHVHGHLRGLAGFAHLGLLDNRPELLQIAANGIDFINRQSTNFGFVPELSERKDDLIGCETCILMDYLDTMIILGLNGYPQYFELVERTVRNHLAESQATDLSWLVEDNNREDTDQITWRNLRSRLSGCYAGWSSPNHILAYREDLPFTWTKHIDQHPIYIGKTRAFQHCCGGSGTKAFYEAWLAIATFEEGLLSVNLHFDRETPEASIRCDKPYKGETRVTLKQACSVRLRLPECASEVSLTVEGEPANWHREGLWAVLEGQLPAGARIVMSHPLPAKTETIFIGNEGFKQYEYEVTWKGDTVVACLGKTEHKRGYTALMDAEVELFYGEDGPGPLYQRQEVVETSEAPASDPLPFVETSPVKLYWR